ncbi:hypothetical protein DUNSADRAFT_17128 [Dunaliella salina]|uniref:CAAX prenyl protease 2/Lysostaphin resistance protein A-like domain-containing protein n=1 Tax=Dunaliella salina TaxID=3046 RepID=A0ABQ7G2C6_DUNSA|nr:hypothetical protein DUNSADRAFT_17128 [Dunaliella salina]|eukprot:KAF5828750.1 hypothetical protein DUNSADRAFT_17128 [Dunaliella salina]
MQVMQLQCSIPLSHTKSRSVGEHLQRSVVAAAKKQAPRKRSRRSRSSEPIPIFDGEDDEDYFPQQPPRLSTPGPLPQAPPPGTRRKRGDDGADAPAYPVFVPRPSNVKEVGKQGAWSWADDGDEGQLNDSTPPLPEWNPQTGFMSSRGFGPQPSSSSNSGSSNRRSVQGSPVPSSAWFRQEPPADAGSGSMEDLPSVPKNSIMTSCLGTSFTMGILALFLRAYALANAPTVLGTDELLLSEFAGRFPSGLGSWSNAGVLVGASATVTALRFILLRNWPEFRQATERSNKQILTPLNWFDIAIVAILTGVSEELLFRGAIIPGSFLDWRGVLISGLIFGVLHNSGGRNAAFAAWATGVGCLYGTSFLITHNIWVPAVAHAASNFISAAAWKGRNTD